ncbi:MAG: hypothetical protein V5A39_11300 [Haloarculaceae archaeon]
MTCKLPLKLGYGLLAVQGLLSVLAPRKSIALATTAWRAGFENVGDLEPREWYVEVTRVLGVGMLVAGLTGLLVSASGDDGEAEGADEPEIDDSDGPVQVDID